KSCAFPTSFIHYIYTDPDRFSAASDAAARRPVPPPFSAPRKKKIDFSGFHGKLTFCKHFHRL
ncbi:MAG: hypothetical protein IK082_09120, partial [Oscillospiraceae bacterium]|nr:hypothetical protein [Oscillospiraceae bacterium]